MIKHADSCCERKGLVNVGISWALCCWLCGLDDWPLWFFKWPVPITWSERGGELEDRKKTIKIKDKERSTTKETPLSIWSGGFKWCRLNRDERGWKIESCAPVWPWKSKEGRHRKVDNLFRCLIQTLWVQGGGGVRRFFKWEDNQSHFSFPPSLRNQMSWDSLLPVCRLAVHNRVTRWRVRPWP